jgi:hypothetical protein
MAASVIGFPAGSRDPDLAGQICLRGIVAKIPLRGNLLLAFLSLFVFMLPALFLASSGFGLLKAPAFILALSRLDVLLPPLLLLLGAFFLLLGTLTRFSLFLAPELFLALAHIELLLAPALLLALSRFGIFLALAQLFGLPCLGLFTRLALFLALPRLGVFLPSAFLVALSSFDILLPPEVVFAIVLFLPAPAVLIAPLVVGLLLPYASLLEGSRQIRLLRLPALAVALRIANRMLVLLFNLFCRRFLPAPAIILALFRGGLILKLNLLAAAIDVVPVRPRVGASRFGTDAVLCLPTVR